MPGHGQNNTNKIGPSKITIENSSNKSGEMHDNQMRRKLKNFRVNMEKTEHPKWIDDMKNKLQDLEEGSEVNILKESQRETLKKKQNWEMAGQDFIHGFWF